ncbi:UBA/TS-N domain protein (macronuclear) [Tetrahymena thermophila SB210]|uniref:UBA/TS-N domain protein n=1 Tax=Tetrahymena thermophila (strain SB210) TaxID=312017 RepID=Q23J87_TETTS|nr:UBA/TS-N domain protein [Tetrahymena thermophila SB210]EAR96617.2 UBA/TS-N domain protein [Tetrahymena thermophila SB210]|eukprot:XP_001016862.2 UBA/TS-N domain protein [Tetrahymena thermophila SB210]
MKDNYFFSIIQIDLKTKTNQISFQEQQINKNKQLQIKRTNKKKNNKMDKTAEGALGSKKLCSKCDKCMQKFLDKIRKHGYEVQYEMLSNKGYDERMILKALKKNKGDVLLAEEFLQNAPPKRERREKHHKRDSQEKQKSDDEKNMKCKNRKERSPSKRKEKLHKMVEEIPNFEDLNNQLSKLGFGDAKENFKALKKNERNPEKAASHLQKKQSLQKLQLRESFSKGELKKIFVDCNNCFFIEHSFIKQSVKGDFKQIEEKIATLMKLFQASYENQIQIVLVFDNSSMMKDQSLAQQFADDSFKLISSKPQFQNADDALVHFASLEIPEVQSSILFVTSDQMLQARLVEKNVKNIMSSKRFFSFIKDNFVGSKAYSAVVEQ